MADRRSLPSLALVGDFGGVGLGDAEAEAGVGGLVLADDADMRGWVGAGCGRCCMVDGGDRCARQFFDCRLVASETSCPWWPLFPGNPLLGAHSLRHETGSNIYAAAAPVPGPGHACHYYGPRGDSLDVKWLRRRGAGWLCYALAADCGCLVRSLTAKALSRFGWTAEGHWAFSETRPCADGALRIWRISRTTDTALGDFWVGP
jgi:hypothetical protein